MPTGVHQVENSGDFKWPWPTRRCLLVVHGAAGGGGAFCVDGLTLYGAAGGDGGEGTFVQYKERTWVAHGGNGGAGGGGGGLDEGAPKDGEERSGCRYGDGGDGGHGADVPEDDRLAAVGGTGGKGFPGETLVVEIDDLSVGDIFEINVGRGGDGGAGGEGFRTGYTGESGANGLVVIAALLDDAA